MTDRLDLVSRPSASLGWARRMVLSFLAAAFLATSTGAFAQAEELLGEWQQLTSNAGACPNCRVTIAGDGQRFRVTANNGWSVNVEMRDVGNGMAAVGSGQWRMRLAGNHIATPFRVAFALRDQRLHMTMSLENLNGPQRRIKAVFGRPWFGA